MLQIDEKKTGEVEIEWECEKWRCEVSGDVYNGYGGTDVTQGILHWAGESEDREEEKKKAATEGGRGGDCAWGDEVEVHERDEF